VAVLPTIEMEKGAERVIFNLSDVDRRRREGWSVVSHESYVADATRIEGAKVTFQECDALAARELGTMPKVLGRQLEALDVVRASRHAIVESAYWQSYAAENWISELRAKLVRGGRIQQHELDDLSAGTMLVWRTLHTYEAFSVVDDLAPLPSQHQGPSLHAALSWLSDLGSWTKEIEAACSHYLGWALPEDRVRSEPVLLIDYKESEALVRAAGTEARKQDLDQAHRSQPKSAVERPVIANLEQPPSQFERAEEATGQPSAPAREPQGQVSTTTSPSAAMASSSTTSHSPDFTSVTWFGTKHEFSKGQQARAVVVLWEAWESGNPTVIEESIGERVGSAANQFRLIRVFCRGKLCHPAWGTMIVRAAKGVFKLRVPGECHESDPS